MNLHLASIVAALLATSSAFGVDAIRVSSFSTVLTEIAQQVGGDRVMVTGHIKPGMDPHEFEPQPADLVTVSKSQLVLLSAKHLEGYVNKLKEATGGKGNIVEVGNQLSSLKMKEGGAVVEDPHWWHSIANMKRAAKAVRDQLSQIRPADKAVLSKNTDAYLVKLDRLQEWVKTRVAELPRDRRKLVTSHDAFQYFAQENGFTIYAIEGVSSSDQPSSKKVAEIIAAIKAQGVKAIFPESIENPKVLKEITRETGAKIGTELYADGLGGGEAATYEGMMKHNVNAIVDALK